jgi:hypothetical protein
LLPGGSYRLTPFYDIISAFPVLGGTGLHLRDPGEVNRFGGRQKMTRIDSVNLRFPPFCGIEPHRGGSYRLTPFYDIISAFPVLGGTGLHLRDLKLSMGQQKEREVLRMPVRCPGQPLEHHELHKVIAIFQGSTTLFRHFRCWAGRDCICAT